MHIHSMSLDQNSMGIRPLLDSTFKCILQILLVCSVVDDRNTQTVVVSEVSLLFLAIAFRDTLDLLELLNLKDVGPGSFAEQRYEYGVLAMCVDAAACTAQCEGGHEEGCTRRRLQHLCCTSHSALIVWVSRRCSRCSPVVCASIPGSHSP